MKVSEVVPLLVGRYLLVKIRTDSGITGIGECGAWGHLEAAEGALRKFGEYLVGENPSAIEHHWQIMQRFSHFNGAAIMGAISAIDLALWDIKGKALNVPVHELLGGPTRKQARLYVHVKAATVLDMVDKCREAKNAGFTAIGHLNPFLDEDIGNSYFKTHVRKLREAADVVAAVRDAVGEDCDLCIELHRRLSPAEAVAFAREIEPFRPLFIEDPIRPHSPEAMARVASRIGAAVATGERLSSVQEFQTLLLQGGASFVRPSIGLCGGLTGALKVARLAEANDIQIVPHHPLSPVAFAACLHLDAAISNFLIQEYPTEPNQPGIVQRGADMVEELPDIRDGFAVIPSTPGLGVALREDVGGHPPRVRPVAMRRHIDGSVMEQ